MPPARSQKTPVPKPSRKALASLSRLVPTRSGWAFVFVGAMPFLVGTGVGLELGVGWGLLAGGAGGFAVGWLLGAD